jgi:hypothetical protein
MTSRGRQMRSTVRSCADRMRAAAGRRLRAPIPPMTPRVIFRALLGLLLFWCGIAFGLCLIIRFWRHSSQEALHT